MRQHVESTVDNTFDQNSEEMENAYDVLCSFLGAHTGEECERLIDHRLVPDFR